MQYEVTMTVYEGRIANQRKVLKWLLFKNYMSENLNIQFAFTGEKGASLYKIGSFYV